LLNESYSECLDNTVDAVGRYADANVLANLVYIDAESGGRGSPSGNKVTVACDRRVQPSTPINLGSYGTTDGNTVVVSNASSGHSIPLRGQVTMTDEVGVADTAITENSQIHISRVATGDAETDPGFLTVDINPGVGFAISSTDADDSSATINYVIVSY
jgi:hypothetical protein